MLGNLGMLALNAKACQPQPYLEDWGDLASKVINTLIGVLSNCKYSYPTYDPGY